MKNIQKKTLGKIIAIFLTLFTTAALALLGMIMPVYPDMARYSKYGIVAAVVFALLFVFGLVLSIKKYTEFIIEEASLNEESKNIPVLEPPEIDAENTGMLSEDFLGRLKSERRAGGFVALFASFGEFLEPSELESYSFATLNILNELFERDRAAVLLSEGGGKAAFILDVAQETSYSAIKENIAKVYTLFVKNFKIRPLLCLGSLKQYSHEAGESLEEAFEAAMYRSVGPPRFIAYDEIKIRKTVRQNYPEQIEKEMLNSLRGCDAESFSDALDTFFSRVSKMNLSYAGMWLRRLIFRLEESVFYLTADETSLENIGSGALSAKTDAVEGFEQKKLIIKRLFAELIETRKTELSGGDEVLGRNVCKFVRNNCSNPSLGIDLLVSYSGLTANSLRSMFKEYTGRTPAEYINDTRIAQAKLLLLLTEFSVKEIAAAVGYENNRYFYTSFKNSEDCTPTDYRNAFAERESRPVRKAAEARRLPGADVVNI
ncbi:MAG: helix-turn-helix transcriptional regulator [Oscillospiraceae bacterium]|jgi:AraC-like DNA-binding protein|nr:helix-turn-helix transcriptional regulator [Oscillospiraceae bacterium]